MHVALMHDSEAAAKETVERYVGDALHSAILVSSMASKVTAAACKQS